MSLSPAAKSRIKIARAYAHERLGSEKYAYPGLNDLDRQVQPYLADFPYGTFLEIGAYDGYSKSNTFNLERSGRWRGILIEPLPSVFKICQRHRKRSQCYNVACGPVDGPSEIELIDRGLMSVAPDLVPEEERDRRIGSVTDTVVAPTMTLSAVIDHSGISHINFMSIDVEGAETLVLSGLDVERHRPDVLLVETDRPDDIAEVMQSTMTCAAQLSFHDYVFVAK